MMYNRKLTISIFLIVALTMLLGLTAPPCSAQWNNWITPNSNFLSGISSNSAVGFGTDTNIWTQNFLASQTIIKKPDNNSSTNGQIVTTSATEFTVTTADQVAVELTVYSNNLGLVKDIRHIQLPVGQGELKFVDVALNINPSSVIAKSQNHPSDFTVLEQTFKNNLMTSGKLLDEYVGKTVKLVDFNMYHNTKNIVEATLLSTPQMYQPYDPYSSYISYPSYEQYGQIYKVDGEIYLGHPGYTVLPEMPEDFIEEPTLVWSYENEIEDAHNLKVSYLTNNINWKADYILILNNEENLADLSSWVTVDNQSGATYKNAHLILVAGNVQRVQELGYQTSYASSAYGGYAPLSASLDNMSAQFDEEAFFEYHTYDLERTTTIKDKESKQIGMLEAPGVATEKEFLVDGGIINYLKRYDVEKHNFPVNVYIKFDNSEDMNLGIPLPAGIMRLFKEDDNNNLYFIGEDYIAHTPINEEVSVKVGEAFDIVVERIQSDFQQVAMNVYESEWEITLRNHKDEDVTVSIREELTDDWEIINNTHPYEEIDAFTIRFDITVPLDAEVVLQYRVRVTEPEEEQKYIPVYYTLPAGYPSQEEYLSPDYLY